jgi:RNA polymerase sigma factor (sigma-70 family)
MISKNKTIWRLMSNVLTQVEIDDIAIEYVRLRERCKNTKSKKLKAKFAKYQNYCVEQLEHLVRLRTNRYKKFSNYSDLNQDGREALILALKTFDSSKGGFAAWAHRYIGTRVSRAANAHSTIRYPLKKAKDLQPHKVSTIPTMIDMRDPQQYAESYEKRNIILKAINTLPENQRKIILLKHDLAGAKSTTSISKISQELEISRPMCVKLLEEAENSLRNRLQSLVETI